MTIHDIINEIQSLNNENTRKSVFEINRLLENNKALLLKHMDTESLNPILTQFDSLTQASHQEYTSESFTYDYQKKYQLLMYYFNKIG